jgi:hypothetical protein
MRGLQSDLGGASPFVSCRDCGAGNILARPLFVQEVFSLGFANSAYRR